MDLPHASSIWPSQNTVSVIIRCKRPYFWSVENTVRTLELRVCSGPLGSPTTCLKVSYVHVPGCPWTSAGTVLVDIRAGLRVPVLGIGRVYGWVYRVGNTGTPTDPLCPRRGQHPAKRAPEAPVGGWSGWDVELGRTLQTVPCTQPCDHHSLRSGPLRCHRPARGGTWPRAAKGREFINISVKLVKTAECRQNILKRPVIVPVSILTSKSHLLIFSDFHIWQPSLPRN